MERQIPIYFDAQIMDSPITTIAESESNIGRLRVAAFTKYKNRNGSYISDAVADQLITSATSGNTPVVGFFDPESQQWASHTGPTLANGYGYVESFLGWEPRTDTDGVTRDYAIFSVVLFSDYFTEATKVKGQNQSMELNPDTITGDWAEMDGEWYYIYKTAKMLGFCIIGDHEPCFSVSSFFSKNDEEYKSQLDKFAQLLGDLKERVAEAEKTIQGGEQNMDSNENNVQVEPVVESVVEPVAEPDSAVEPTNFENAEPAENNEPEVVEPAAEPAAEPAVEPAAEPTEFEALQAQYDALAAANAELTTNYAAVQEQLHTLEASHASEIEALNNTINDLKASLATYQAQVAAAETAKKTALIENYEKIIGEEEISEFKSQINDFSYDELDSKLAIKFAHKQINSGDKNTEKVPLLEPEESQFALLMKKYRKN